MKKAASTEVAGCKFDHAQNAEKKILFRSEEDDATYGIRPTSQHWTGVSNMRRTLSFAVFLALFLERFRGPAADLRTSA